MCASHLVAVVDDDPSILRALRRLLRVAGFAAETFLSGEELLEWAALSSADCLVLDVNLAGLSGFQVQERLRDRRLAIPIVFITAQDDEQTRERAQRGGGARYLRKPFDDQTLIAEIHLALAEVVSQSENRHDSAPPTRAWEAPATEPRDQSAAIAPVEGLEAIRRARETRAESQRLRA